MYVIKSQTHFDSLDFIVLQASSMLSSKVVEQGGASQPVEI